MACLNLKHLGADEIHLDLTDDDIATAQTSECHGIDRHGRYYAGEFKGEWVGYAVRLEE